jgi:hypothetical protein
VLARSAVEAEPIRAGMSCAGSNCFVLHSLFHDNISCCQGLAATSTVSDFVPLTLVADGTKGMNVTVQRSDNRTGLIIRLLAGGFSRIANDSSVRRSH